MRNVSYIIILLLLLCCGRSEAAGQGRLVDKPALPVREQPTLQEMGLHGKVQRVVAVQQYQGGNDMNMQEEWLFDDGGRLQQHVKTGFGGTHTTNYPRATEPDRRQKVTRDDDGDIQEVRRYAAAGHLVASSHYIYAEGGTLAAIVTYYYETGDDNVVTSHAETYFGKEGRRTSMVQYTADAVLQMEEHCKYNRHGDLVKRVQTFYNGTDRDVTIERHKYKYDRKGNWTSNIYINNGKTYYTTHRTITYFR